MASGNKIVIAFLSVSTESSTDKLIEQIKRENADFRCVFVKLTQQDLQSFQPRETYDAVVLLHSISQGRNSITDVADAKYSKLLPQLKWIYGPDRVAAVVHSMTSFNSNSKMAMMMIFRKSQPTTFQCSKCVIQCNNLAEMLAEDLSRLTEFLGKVPDHPLPIPEDEAYSTLNTTPSADKIDRIETGGKPQSMSVSGSVTTGDGGMASDMRSTNASSMCQKEVVNDSPEDLLRGGLKSDVFLTQPTKNKTSMTSYSSAGMKDSNLQNMASGTPQFVACFSDTDQISQASTKVVTSPDRHVTKDKVIDTTCPIAFVNPSSLPSSSSASMGDVNLHNMASSTSQPGACTSDAAPASQASPEVDTSTFRLASQDKVIDTTYPIAFVNLSLAHQPEKLKDDLQRQFPGKTIMLIENMDGLTSSAHLFEAILVNLGSLQEAVSYSSDDYKGAFESYQKCIKKMLVPENIAVLMFTTAKSPSAHKHAVPQNLATLMLNTAKTPSSFKRASDITSHFPKLHEVPVFQYSSESCRPPLFDDITKEILVSWVLDSYERYHIAVRQKESGFSKRDKTWTCSIF